MAVQLDDPSSPSSRIFTSRLEAPADSTVPPAQRVAFDPLPPGALSGVPQGSAVVSQVLQLGFDAYGDPAANNTGVGRLALATADGAPVAVANLTVPISFQLPALNVTTGQQASCQFWDEARRVYSSEGCVGHPNPRPRDHTVAWRSGFSTTTNAGLIMAWTVSGPLADNCTEVYLDCTGPGASGRLALLDPTQGIESDTVRGKSADPCALLACAPGCCGVRRAPSEARYAFLLTLTPSARASFRSSPPLSQVTCAGASLPALRLFTGPHCPIRSNVSSPDCYWNALKQAFEARLKSGGVRHQFSARQKRCKKCLLWGP